MKVCIIITVKLIAIALTVYFLNDPTQQIKTHTADTLCLKTDSKQNLCAQCFKRDNSILYNKGYHIGSNAVASVLKI